MDPINPEIFRNDQLAVSTLPTLEEVSFDKLSPKLLLKKSISTSISFILFLAISGAAFYVFPEFFKGYYPLVLLGIFLIFLWNYIKNWQWQKRSGYALRERDVIFKRGFLLDRITIIPFNRIQHVSTERGVLDKILGISTLQIFTAGGSGSDISIPGLTPPLAASLKEALSERIARHV